MHDEETAFVFDQAERERQTFGVGPNRVSIALTDDERGLLECIAAGWGVSVPVASRRLLLLAASVSAP